MKNIRDYIETITKVNDEDWNLFSSKLHKKRFPKKSILTKIGEEFGIKISDPARLPEFRHTFSHFHLQITPIKSKLKGFTGIHETKLSWDSIENWLERGIPAAVRTMLLQYKDLN